MNKFASKAEASFAEKLSDNNIKWEYESIRIPWIPSVKYYKPDFVVHTRDGKEKIVEFKGYFRATDRAMLKAIKEQHQDLDITLVFQKPKNKLHPKSSTTYKDWAIKYGFNTMTEQELIDSIK